MSTNAVTPDTIHLWAKLKDRTGPAYHPVTCHLIDVGLVAREMWQTILPRSVRSWVARELGLGENDEGIDLADQWVTLLTALHDIGKASDFQGRDAKVRTTIQSLDISIPMRAGGDPVFHATMSGACWEREIGPNLLKLEKGLTRRIASLTAGHHGRIPTPIELHEAGEDEANPKHWRRLRQMVYQELVSNGRLIVPMTPPKKLPTDVALWLAGFISVCDWIGSDETYFPMAMEGWSPESRLDLDEYTRRSAWQAKRALRQLGWLDAPNPLSEAAAPDPGADLPGWLSRCFGFSTPNTMQHRVVEIARGIPAPSLMIIETPMGSGKTEAALALADLWSRHTGQQGFYLALPTRATSDLIFHRLLDYLPHRYGDARIGVQLLHGLSDINADVRLLAGRPLKVDEKQVLIGWQHQPDPKGVACDLVASIDETGNAPGPVVAEWFTYRKRGLLAPFGVGTIDQILLGALATRHGFVRLFGLAGKTVIIDEVHAYDTYMLTLLRRLLTWLSALNCPVVLLSATLPEATRIRLARSYAWGRVRNDVEIPVPQASYPRLTWVTADGACDAATVPIADEERASFTLRLLPTEPLTDPFAWADDLRSRLDEGGTAAVICTTVRRAQKTAADLQARYGDDGPTVMLLHSRFMTGTRAAIEQEILRRFGKASGDEGRQVRGRPGIDGHSGSPGIVVVATQIIEQSLDIDFDVMVSDPAPVDLLLQRAGRLHRHHWLEDAGRRERERPTSLAQPELWLRRPDDRTGHPAGDRGATFVYDDHIMLRSWLTLRERLDVTQTMTIAIPDDIEQLVESVYDDRPCPDRWAGHRSDWYSTRKTYDDRGFGSSSKAVNRCVDYPWSEERSLHDVTTSGGATLGEEGSPLHAELIGETRESHGPSVTLICLRGSLDDPLLPSVSDFQARVGTSRQSERRVSFQERPTDKVLAEILLRTVRVSSPADAKRLLWLPEVSGPWARRGHLRMMRPVFLDHVYAEHGIVVRHDDRTGLVIERIGEGGDDQRD